MNWDAIGAIAELIGSLAVLATLIYLTAQVRRARIESRAALLQHRSDAARQLWEMEIANPHLLNAMVQAREALDEPLPPAVERIKERTNLDAVQAWMIVLRCAANLIHRQTMYLSDLTDAEQRALNNQLKVGFGSGVNRIYFDTLYDMQARGRGGFDSEFLEHIRSLLSEEEIS